MSDHNNGQSREEQQQSTRSFNPNEHVIQLKSKQGSSDYLPVQWRLVWFRSICPHGTIETEMIHLDLDRETEEEVSAWNAEKKRSEKVIKRAPGIAVFRAVVKDGMGGIATATKSERAASFGDFLEKAETGAIGRALAALGYGTQFTGDELNESHRIVDAPVERATPAEINGTDSNGNGNRSLSAVHSMATRAKTNGNDSKSTTASADISLNAAVTEQQLASIRKLCEHLGKPEPENSDALSYGNAKELIIQLSQEYNQSRKAS